MFGKIIHFIKYNNAVVLIIALVLVLGTSALASDAGQAAIGQKQTIVEGVDNTLLLAANLDNFDMDFKVEKIEEDEEMYYVTYTYLDLVNENSAWQYQLKENTRRISKKSAGDLGIYLAGELKEEYDARIKELKQAQVEAEVSGEEKRVAVTEYSGLIGASLDLAAKIFPGYEPIKTEDLESPVTEESLRQLQTGEADMAASGPDNLTQVYQNYIEENDPDTDNVFGSSDNCPTVSNPDQADSNNNGVGDACEVSEPVEEATSTEEETPAEEEIVEIIELPVEESESVDEPAAEEGTTPTDEAAPVDNPAEAPIE
ncbi:MAG: thrombospondin type 3 repeat-containing protein [Patescibacteria group bacterium]|nr:thrombospondin type 3 repeat-containing protein [Patescibacteria group bacterium]MDD5295161.1 thrombospondin type 3 repeat-containing protein [Patescibacteria group bacterium]MDD5554777.1 thrombospondin type 3 repeat-containing protein [Patescibacteria group bacterium]